MDYTNREVKVVGYEELGNGIIKEEVTGEEFPFVVQFLDDTLHDSEKIGYFSFDQLIFLESDDDLYWSRATCHNSEQFVKFLERFNDQGTKIIVSNISLKEDGIVTFRYKQIIKKSN